jgi:hypothetical protein
MTMFPFGGDVGGEAFVEIKEKKTTFTKDKFRGERPAEPLSPESSCV